MSQNQIPKDWYCKKISEISKSYSGGTPRTENSEYWENGTVPWLRSGDLEDNILNESEMFITEKALAESSAKLWPKNSVLIAITGANIGKTALLAFESSGNQSIVGILPNDEVSSKFLWYYLQYSYKYFWSKAVGGAQPHINGKIVSEREIIYPDLETQKKIVQKLDYVIPLIQVRINSILKINSRQIKHILKSKSIFLKSLIDAASFGKLTLNWQEKNQNNLNTDYLTKIKILDNDQYKFPKSWTPISIGNISEIRGGVTLGRKINRDTIKVPYLRVANVQDGYFNLKLIKEVDIHPNEFEKWKLRKGDILLTEGGDWDKLGRGSVWNDEIPNCIHQNHIFRVRVNLNEFNSEFLSLLLRSSYGKTYFQNASKQTTNLATINSTQLKDFTVFCPSFAEQNEIVKIVKERISDMQIINSEIETYVESKRQFEMHVKSVYSSILSNVFSGNA